MRSVPVPVAETAWTLLVNGEAIGRGTASPGQARELTAGLTVADGFVARLPDLLGIQVRETAHGVTLDARVEPDRFTAAFEERRHRTEHGCGLLHYVSCDSEALRVPAPLDVPREQALAEGLSDLFDACRRFHPAGGVHAAALVNGDDNPFRAVDVSRHAAVEKVIGSAFLEGAVMADYGLVLTARISGQIAYTAARAGMGWIASRSIPTTLAVAIAAAAGQTIVARAGSREAHTFTPPKRNGHT